MARIYGYLGAIGIDFGYSHSVHVLKLFNNLLYKCYNQFRDIGFIMSVPVMHIPFVKKEE